MKLEDVTHCPKDGSKRTRESNIQTVRSRQGAKKNDKKVNNLSKVIKIEEKRKGPGGGQPQNFEPV